MAIFDVAQQRMCVRVVYDGVASAGKTTNLRQLAELFATQRTCELVSPAEMEGRTLFFDWLQIAAGMVCGFPLLCQVITVPGQLVLTPRRRHLLATADVVVHVCDSEEHSIGRALEGLAVVDEVDRERRDSVPLVIQANKQDQAGALSGAALTLALGRPSVPVVEAIASDGIGVIDTFVTAVRAVVRSIQQRVESGRVHVPVGRAETSAAVLEKLSAETIDPEWELEMILEQASNELTFGDTLDEPANDEEPETWKPERLSRVVPAFPTEHVPTGFIWPAHTGRAALRALAAEPEANRRVLHEEDGSVRVVVADFALSTGTTKRFETAESARQALVRAARERTKLGPLLATETVLVAQPAGDETSWLWTVLPKMPTVAELVASRDDAEFPRSKLLAAYGAAIADALKVEALHGMVLDLSARSFGIHHGEVRYVGEMTSGEGPRRDLGRALETALFELATACDEIEPAVGTLESAILARLTADEIERLAASTTWSDPSSVPDALRDAQRRIATAFDRGRRAA